MLLEILEAESPTGAGSLVNPPLDAVGSTDVAGVLVAPERSESLPSTATEATTEIPQGIPEGLELLPARMVNEYAYCPRLFYLMYVQREWAASIDTLDGRFVHRRVDRPEGKAPLAEALTDNDRLHARSIQVGSLRLGALAVVDVLESEGQKVTPVDYKRSKAPDIPEQAWEPEQVQVCLQGLLLRENGYQCDEAVLYYAGSKTRVTIPLSERLMTRTLDLLEQARRAASLTRIPPPLKDSPKCPRCSLVGICLPDEVNLLKSWPAGEGAFELEIEEEPLPSEAPLADVPEPMELELLPPPAGEQALRGSAASQLSSRPEVLGSSSPAQPEPRRMLPARSDKVPLYIQGQGYSLGLSGDLLEVREKGKKLDEVRMLELSQVSLFGNVQLSAQALRELTAREIIITHLSYAGWIHAITTPMMHKNIMLRQRQYEVASDPVRCLTLAKAFVQGKVKNARTLLRRNGKDISELVLRSLAMTRRDIALADGLPTLLGVEGNAARLYFSSFTNMLKSERGSDLSVFDFQGRNRRPPKDPLNALLSFVYALLTKDLIATLVGIGLDPFLGFYHQPRYGRPALALDMIEEFRPLVGDSVVIGLINNGTIGAEDFLARAGACMLTDTGRKRVIEAYERRMDMLVTHPLFGYTLSYRRVFEVQARLLSRYLLGELPRYEPFCTR